MHDGEVMNDGRVMYTRWEYSDTPHYFTRVVMRMNPDGTNHAVYWGNNTNSPGAVLDARPIPGTDLFIGNFSSCHDRPWGALAVVDRLRAVPDVVYQPSVARQQQAPPPAPAPVPTVQAM